MYPIRVGQHVLNLEFWVRTVIGDGTEATEGLPPGEAEVVMVPGAKIRFRGADVELLLRHLQHVVAPDPAAGRSPSPPPLVRPDAEKPRGRGKKGG